MLSLRGTLANFFAHRRRCGFEVRHGRVRQRLADHPFDVLEQAILIM